MSDTLRLASLADGTILSPFSRLRQLLHGVEPGARPIDLTLGEPRETIRWRMSAEQWHARPRPPIAIEGLDACRDLFGA